MRRRAYVRAVRFGGAVTLLAPTCTVLEVTVHVPAGLALIFQHHLPHTRASAPLPLPIQAPGSQPQQPARDPQISIRARLP
jgi:hypothetical protein